MVRKAFFDATSDCPSSKNVDRLGGHSKTEIDLALHKKDPRLGFIFFCSLASGCLLQFKDRTYFFKEEKKTFLRFKLEDDGA